MTGIKTIRMMCSILICLWAVSTSVVGDMHKKQPASKANASSAKTKEQDHKHKEGASKEKCMIAGRAGKLQSTKALLGMALRNLDNAKVGHAEEVILDDSRREVEYLIISANGKLYPVPWTALDTGKETYTLDIQADSLYRAPSIKSLRNSDFSDSVLREKSHAYYEDQIKAVQDKNIAERAVDWAKETVAEVYSDEPAPMVYSANEIIGYEVQNKEGDDIGELQDIVFHTRKGNLAYGLISFGGFLGIGEKTAAVPWETIQLESTREIATLEADKSDLQEAVLKDGNIQKLSYLSFARRIHESFGQKPYWEVFGFMAPAEAQTDGSQ